MRTRRSAVVAMRGLVVVGLLVAGVVVAPAGAQAATTSVTFTAVVSGGPSKADVVQYSGVVSRTSPGTSVYVEQRSGSGRWSTVGVAPTGARGVYRGTFSSGTAGPAVLRARIRFVTGGPSPTSATRRLTLSTWFPLARLTPSTPSSSVTRRTITADGIQYPDSLDYNARLAADGGLVAESWALSRRCSYLDASAVYTGTDAGAGEQGQATVAVDGDAVVKSVVAPDEPAIVARAVLRGARTLVLAVDFDTKEQHSDITWLTPRLLCSSVPPGA